MKSQLSRSLNAEFQKRMRIAFPEFEKVGTASGGVIYRRSEPEKGRYFFILLLPSPKLDRFTVELASNSSSEYPFELLPGDVLAAGASRFRISKFVGDSWDGWWNLNESSEPDMKKVLDSFSPTSINEALDRIPRITEQAFRDMQTAVPRFYASVA